MRELDILDKIKERLESLLRNMPFLKIRQTVMPTLSERIRPDLLFEVREGNRIFKILVEVKSIGEPRQVRYAIQQLSEYLRQVGGDYGIVATNYITEDTARLCKENGIGYIDLVGNCFLNFDKVYIEQRNYPNVYIEKRQLRSIFSPRSNRLLRVMLNNPKRSWQVQELAKEANVSIGLASKVKERLLDLEYAVEQNRNILLNRPEELLSKWADNYSFRKNKLYDYFSVEEPKDMEKWLAKYCEEKKIRYALTLFSGAALVAPFARYNRGFAYVSNGIKELAESIGFKEVSSGATFSILEPYDEGVFYGTRKIQGLEVACDVQLYLDLVGFKGRGEESAKFLLEQRIKPKW